MSEAFVMLPPGTGDLVRKPGRAAEAAKVLGWQLHELAMVPVERLPGFWPR